VVYYLTKNKIKSVYNVSTYLNILNLTNLLLLKQNLSAKYATKNFIQIKEFQKNKISTIRIVLNVLNNIIFIRMLKSALYFDSTKS
jgi:hypothetical protein